MIFIKLCWTFLKIGVLGFGGGYAMLSLIQDEVVQQNGWMSNQEFTDLVAISQSTPGPIGINTATYAGYWAVQNEGYSLGFSLLGSVLATFSVCLPAFLIIGFICYAFQRFRRNTFFNGVLAGVRPLGPALIIFAAYALMTPDNFTDFWSVLFFMSAFFMSAALNWHPGLILLLTALAGLLVY